MLSFEDLDEFPALPDLTIPFLGGIHNCIDGAMCRVKRMNCLACAVSGRVCFT